MIDSSIPKKGEDDEKLFELVVEALNKGTKKKTIVKGLVRKGWSETKALNFIDEIEQKITQCRASLEGQLIMEVVAGKYKRHMLYGILWILGGTVMTIISYGVSNGTGIVIFFGAIGFGIFDLFRGLIGWLKNRPSIH